MRHSIAKIIYILLTFLCIASCKKDAKSNTVDDLKAENRKVIGTSAEDLLSDDIYPKLNVELVYFGLYKPSEESITNLRTFLIERLNKPTSINIIETSIAEPQGAPFNTEEIKAIEDVNRTEYTDGDTISIYIFFSNGKSSNDSNTTVTLGSAYFNTSIVIYQKTILDIVNTDPDISLVNLETTTIHHELGHLLGLVNLQDDDIHMDHEDLGHRKHCIIEDCLMYFESNTRSAVMQRFSNRSNISQLDPLCIADLQTKGGL